MDYFNYGSRRRGNSINQNQPNTPIPQQGAEAPAAARPQRPGGSLESLRAPSNIRIRRLPSGMVPQTPRPTTQQGEPTTPAADTSVTGRRRSSSEPHRATYGTNLAPPQIDLSRQRTQEDARMPTLTEETTARTAQQTPSPSPGVFYEAQETPRPETPATDTDSIRTPGVGMTPAQTAASRVQTGASTMQDAGNAARANRGLNRFRSGTSLRNEQTNTNEYNSDVVDLLDLVDPEVRTLGTLTNVQNSLFVPDLGRLINRRPTYNLTQRPSSSQSADFVSRSRAGTGAARPPDLPTIPQQSQRQESKTEGDQDIELQPSLGRRLSISSNLSDSRYAVLPHGINLDDWTEEDKAELDDHVRHLMHSRREGFKRSMRGFKQYISKPLGLFVFVYATLVTLFGAAWVFFLIGWIYVGHRQQYIINIVDNILVALFALIGDGMAPFRAVDTYHMCFIARYHHMTWRLRKEKDMPELVDHNDLPDRRMSASALEDAIDKEERAEVSVLKPIQQKRLQYHQAKFSKAHTFYRPHETVTHHAFPLRLLVAVVVLLDCHSLFQVALGSCTWSWDYHTRPEALTATILSCSITCNIVAGVLISIGDHRTRKKDVLERINRQNLTEEAIERMAKKRQSEELVRKSVQASQAVQRRDQVHEEIAEQQAAGPSMLVQTPTHDLEDEQKIDEKQDEKKYV